MVMTKMMILMVIIMMIFMLCLPSGMASAPATTVGFATTALFTMATRLMGRDGTIMVMLCGDVDGMMVITFILLIMIVVMCVVTFVTATLFT